MATKNQVTLTFAGDSSKLEQAFGRVGESAKTMQQDVGKAGKQMARESGASFDKVGEGFDNTETKALGFKDTLDGVGGTMSGVSQIAKGDLYGGLLTVGQGMADLAGGVANFVVPALKGAVTWIRNTTVAQKALNLAMRLNPIGLVITALVLLGAGLVLAYKKSETFRNIVNGAFRALATTGRFVLGLFTGVVKFIGDNWKRLPLLLLGPVGGVLLIFRDLPGKILIKLAGLGSLLLQKGRDLIGGLTSGIVERWTRTAKWISGIPASAGRWLGDVTKTLLGKGRDLLQGFWNGLTEKWKKVTEWVAGIAQWIKDHKGPVSLDAQLLVPAGQAIMDGFLSGLKAGAGKAWSFVQSVGGKSVEALRSAIGGPFMGGNRAPTNPSGLAALVRTVAASRGWGNGSEWDALYNLVQHESGFNANAQNPTSSAYGLFQFLDSTWGSVGGSKTSDPWRQTELGLRYISNAYGSPSRAWSAWLSRSPHWYAQGTPWVPDDQLAFLHRGEAVVPASVNRRIRNGGGGGITIVVNGALDPVAVAQQIQKVLLSLKRTNGGARLGLA